ncbi:uncharacterized protein STEHIDRAFT_172322 [Stereum hirsutum FP-91666 SS1]|uniref:uncharacterized protein n=1 Tax=Stereum hirsutum (strain FP-91666) TaxID=721885 RepID=UPI00044499B1|nr:uncharacterized protein STEHIDRAFT_172322 [Stereum hirsutum FP-91666 SS1]EIM80561.1 hypothetical protein STEHIDRAFT_172322 [Stereum hirsutum FP-91666 SS1]
MAWPLTRSKFLPKLDCLQPLRLWPSPPPATMEEDHWKAFERSANAYWSAAVEPRLEHASHLTSSHHVHNPQERENAQQMSKTLDLEYKAIQRASSRIATLRNLVTPICALPSELISHIFSFCIVHEPPGTASREITVPGYLSSQVIQRRTLTSHRLGWIKVTQVCRHWREVALEDPMLWTTICFPLGKKWIREMLSRARDAPLIINDGADPDDFYDDDSEEDETAAGHDVRMLIAKHLSHIRDLKWVAGGMKIDRVLAKTLKHPAPLLERVKLTAPAYFDSPADLSTVPSCVFSRSAPRLRHLSLYGFAWIEKSPSIHNLTHFNIGYYPPGSKETTGNVCHVPFTNFLDTLGHMPNLQELLIHDIAPSTPSQSEVGRIITLPHLKVLSLSGEAADSIIILEHLRFPSLGRFELVCGNPTTPFNSFGPLFQLLETHIRTPAFEPLRTLGIHYRARHFNIRAWPLSTVLPSGSPKFTYTRHDSSSESGESSPLNSTVRQGLSDNPPPPILRLALHWKKTEEYSALRMLEGVVPRLNLTQLQTLSISDEELEDRIDADWNTERCVRLWRAAGDVKHLSVSCSNPIAVFMTQALVGNVPIIDRSNPSMPPDDQFIFPKLTTLDYNNIDCLKRRARHPLSFRQLLPFVIQARKSKSALEKRIPPIRYLSIDLLENEEVVNWYWEKKLESMVDKVVIEVEEYSHLWRNGLACRNGLNGHSSSLPA